MSDLLVDSATLRHISSKLQGMIDEVAVTAPLHDGLAVLGSADVTAAAHDVDVSHRLAASSCSDEFTTLAIVPSIFADEMDAAEARLAATASRLS